MGAGCLRLYGDNCSLDQGVHFCASRSKYGGGRFLENRPVPPFSLAFVSGFAVGLRFYFWAIRFFLGKGKAVSQADGKSLFTQLMNCLWDEGQLPFVDQKAYLCCRLKKKG